MLPSSGVPRMLGISLTAIQVYEDMSVLRAFVKTKTDSTIVKSLPLMNVLSTKNVSSVAMRGSVRFELSYQVSMGKGMPKAVQVKFTGCDWFTMNDVGETATLGGSA